MNNLGNRNWAEQYEESAFAMKMEEYAEAEGKRLMEEYEQALAAGEVSAVPMELDAKCKRLIKREFKQQKYQLSVRNVWKKVGKVVAIFIVVFSLSAAVVMSVDALRIPIINFFMEHYDRYTALYSNEAYKNGSSSSKSPEECILNRIPLGYELVGFSDDESFYYVRFENEKGDILTFSEYPSTGELLVDTEDAIVSEMKIGENEALLIEKDGYELYWIMDDKVCYLSATCISKDVLVVLAHDLLVS